MSVSTLPSTPAEFAAEVTAIATGKRARKVAKPEGAVAKVAAAKALAKAKGKPDLKLAKAGKRAAKGEGKGKGKIALPPEPAGRGKLISTLSADALQAEINALLVELIDSTDGEEKKRIRRKLRLRGHRGGSGAKPGRKAA